MCVTIGIDQSYKETGISMFRDGTFVKLVSIGKCPDESNADFRNRFREYLQDEINYYVIEGDVKVICEQIRLKSRNHISLPYITRMSALTSCIVDVCEMYGIKAYDVDTRVWKAAIVGTSKPKKNKYGIPEEKYPTILYMKHRGLLKEIVEPYDGRGKKGVVVVNMDGQKVRCKLNDNKADAYCIGEFGVKYPERLNRVSI